MAFEGGDGYADTQYNDHVRHARNAFLNDSNAAWRNLYALPQKVWYQFPSNENYSVVTRVAMSSRGAASSTGKEKWPGAPAKFDLIGSFDALKWYTVLKVDVENTTGSYFSGFDQEKEWSIPDDKKRSYPIWGIRCKLTTVSVIPHNDSLLSDPNNCFVSKVRMWRETFTGEISQKQVL